MQWDAKKDLSRDIQNHDWYHLFKVKSNQPTLLNNISGAPRGRMSHVVATTS